MASETATMVRTGKSENDGAPPWRGLYVLLLAGFVTIFDLFVVNVAIPSMRADLGASFSQVGFIVAGYELAFGVLLITGGRLGDLHGRRWLFAIGMIGFTLASALCGLAPRIEVLIAARILQGLAAALLFPQVYASIRVNFTDADSRRAFALLGMTLGLAAIAGQVVGGWLVAIDLHGLGWRTIFLINIPVGIVAVVMARWIPETRATDRPALDWVGVVLASLGLTLVLVPLVETPTHGWTLASSASLITAILLLAAFVGQQERRRRRGRQPLVDMTLLADPRFAQGGVLVTLIYSTASSFFLCFALLVQTGFGLGPFEAGRVFVPCSIGFVGASLAAPRLVGRFGTPAIAVSAVLYTLSIAALIAQVWLAGPMLVPARLMPVLLVLGAGQGLIMTPLLNLVLGFVDERRAGMASGVISTLQQVGAALGVAAVGILFGGVVAGDSSAGAGAYAAGFSRAMLYNLAAATCAAALLVALARRDGRRG